MSDGPSRSPLSGVGCQAEGRWLAALAALLTGDALCAPALWAAAQARVAAALAAPVDEAPAWRRCARRRAGLPAAVRRRARPSRGLAGFGPGAAAVAGLIARRAPGPAGGWAGPGLVDHRPAAAGPSAAPADEFRRMFRRRPVGRSVGPAAARLAGMPVVQPDRCCTRPPDLPSRVTNPRVPRPTGRLS